MATTRTKHAVLFPFPGHGHLAGFLAMARLLVDELPDTTVTLVSTPRNVAALRSSLSAVSQSTIRFHALPFVPGDHGLPAGCESTSSLTVPAFIMLFEAFEALQPAFEEYVSGLRRESGDEADICIVADAFVAWTVDVARRHGCKHAVFVSCGAFGTAIFHALWNHMPELPFGSDGMLRLPEHPDVVLHRSQLPVAFLRGDLSDRWTAYYHRVIRYGHCTDAVLANTVEEFEPTGLSKMRRAAGKVPVWPIGPLVRGDDSGVSSQADDEVLRWLDTQPPSSVLYISFGSQNTIQPNQMMELAAVLETTGRPFVWAIRPPVGFDIAGPFRDEWLPEGFEARARAGNRGLVVRGWAPQVRILAHGATGAFLSHCGWNSVLESMAHGVPVVGWPLAAEQFYNVRMLAEWGVCVELARGNLVESSAVERSKVAEVVETVMGDTVEAATMRRRVMEVQEVMKSAWRKDGGSSRMALHEFLRAMHLQ
ncbi:hypothetical protein BS78_01G151300 [Paspalum vaginatum]|nr:hypothetical protein BS78_01G151300 [Paspalum vaginatum]